MVYLKFAFNNKKNEDLLSSINEIITAVLNLIEYKGRGELKKISFLTLAADKT